MLTCSAEVEVQGEHVGGQTDGYNNGWLLGSLQSISLEPQTYDVLLKGKDTRTLQPWSLLALEAHQVRPSPIDDSLTIPLSARHIGEAVDCWAHDIWWSGFISETHLDRVLVNFPSWPHYDDYVVREDEMRMPGAYRIRTSRKWLTNEQRWAGVADLRLPHYRDKRPKLPKPLTSGEDQAKSSPQPRQPKPAAISPQLWAAIQAPLQMHMLRKLPPPSLAAARRSCQAFQQLIDTAPADFLFPCMRHLLPHGMEVHASTGCDLLDMLGGQQALISNLRSGHSGRVMMTDKHMRQESEVHWPPSYPSRYALISSNTKKLLTLPGGAQGSVTDFTELHVLDASGKSGPSSWGTAVPELKVPGEVQWIYACHESGIMLVDSWDCTDQRLLQVLDITSQGSPPRTQRSRYGMPPSALSISNGLVLLAMDGYVQVLDMSNLDEMCRVHPCSSPTASGFSEASDSCHSDPHPDWCNWSADGSLFAVAWGECGSFLGGVITIYNTLSHAAVGQSTVPLCRSDSEIAHLEYTWSPSAPLILVKAVSSTADEGPRQGRVTIIDHDGRCRFLEFCLEMVDCLAGWSSCGRFMHFIIDKDLSLTEERGAGYIWDTISRQRVFNWRVGTPGLKSHSIVWASAAAKEAACFIHSCSVILTWAPGGDGIPRISSLWPHAEASPAALSPCGRVHISKWSVPRPTASYTIPSWQANNVSSNNIPRLSQLWHSVLRPGHDSCSMQMVEALAGRWHLDSVAWHPNPAAGAIYAIMHSSGDVMLIDGLQHAIISSWPRPRMFPTAEEPLEAEAFVCLQWSPDGTKLLVAIDNDCAVICFGGIVGPIPTSKRVQKG